MNEKRERQRNNDWPVYILLGVATILFSGFGWFIIQPETAIGMVSTVSFGVGLSVLIWLLIHFDEMMKSRWSRFAVDVLIGLLLVTLIYVFMLGFTVYFEFILVAFGIVFVLSLLFAFRRVAK